MDIEKVINFLISLIGLVFTIVGALKKTTINITIHTDNKKKPTSYHRRKAKK